jgi:hypothetical protein
MSPYKPMKRRDFERLINPFGWSLVKAGMDWKVLNEVGKIAVRNVIVTHPGNEVIPLSINKTRQALKAAGLLNAD